MHRRSYAPRLVDWTGERCVPWAPDDRTVYEHIHRYRWASQIVGSSTVLDVGSGEGFGAATLAEAGARVHGIDIDRQTVDHARLNYGSARVSFSVDDGTTLAEVTDASFDAVVAFEVLEHVAAQTEMLAAIKRVLRPGGLLIISTPNRVRYTDETGQHNPFHVSELTEQEFRDLLTANFRFVHLCSQSAQAGSHISSLDRPDGAGHEEFHVQRRQDFWVRTPPPDPLYMLAAASDLPVPAIPAVSTLLDLDVSMASDHSHGHATSERAADRDTHDAEFERLRAEHRSELAVLRSAIALADSAASNPVRPTNDSGLEDDPWPRDDVEFVDRCHTRVFGRWPSPAEREHLVERLPSVGRARLLAELLDSAEHQKAIASHPFVPPGHFYSPIPSDEAIEAHRAFDWNVEELDGIDLRARQQRALLDRFAEGYGDLPWSDDRVDGLRYRYGNPNYSYSDAIFLASMIRELRPKRFIEVGSGDSSCVVLDTNERFADGEIELTFVEPYPRYLRSLLSDEEWRGLRVLDAGLQDVPLAEFERLEANDVLFVDSTHVSKLGSDVNRLVFDILPRLAPGVHVHIHDVFWPFEYPHEWLADGRAWNEQYVLRSFLEFNSDFEIALFGHWAVTRNREWFAEHMPLCVRNPGGAIWLRRAR